MGLDIKAAFQNLSDIKAVLKWTEEKGGQIN